MSFKKPNNGWNFNKFNGVNLHPIFCVWVSKVECFNFLGAWSFVYKSFSFLTFLEEHKLISNIQTVRLKKLNCLIFLLKKMLRESLKMKLLKKEKVIITIFADLFLEIL